MPYIIKEKRPQYIPIIENTVSKICEEKDDILKAEYLGYFLEQMCDELGLDISKENKLFCSFALDLTKKNDLTLLAKDACSRILLNSIQEILKQAGEINYVMSAVIWGILGDSLYASNAGYGFRVYVKAGLCRLYKKMELVQSTRNNIMLSGVLSDVIDEMYRRKTAKFEDQKIIENGDIWPLQDVTWIEKVPLDIRRDSDEKIDQLYE
jgi:hypothetical protein